MKTQTYVRSTELPISAAQAYAWHESPGAFEALVPPWEDVRLVREDGGIVEGGEVLLSVPLAPLIRKEWLARYRDVKPGQEFTDVQIRGPFRAWEHTHRLHPISESRCRLEDSIKYALPFGPLGRVFGGSFALKKLDRLFDWRHASMQSIARSLAASSGASTMKILITGASGLLGSDCVSRLTSAGHEVLKAKRPGKSGSGPEWDPDNGINPNDPLLSGLDAVIHLAGENIGSSRWTESKMKAIRDSRVVGTQKLCESLAQMKSPPKAFISASAVGFYGDRGDEILTADSAPGEGFLAEVCKEWEAAAEPARKAGLRVAHLRFGFILSATGGGLPKLITPFKLGVGGRIGSGNQYMSWVAQPDVISAIVHATTHDSVSGPLNVVAPNPVSNKTFTKTLGKVLKRPTFFPLPGFMAKIVVGKMADELLLSGQRATPEKLLASNFVFDYPELEDALRAVLGKTS